MELTPIILLVSLLAFMLIGVPIAWALSLSCFAALLTMDSMPLALLTQRVFNGANNFSFLAVPAFVVAGEVMSQGGISKKLVDMATCARTCLAVAFVTRPYNTFPLFSGT